MHDDTTRLRGEAERLRNLARTATSEPIMSSLNGLADEYEREADAQANGAPTFATPASEL
jgi:hypothetical protein